MSKNENNALNQLLDSLMETANDETMTDMLEAAHNSFTDGVNDFVERVSGKLQPADFKQHLRIYPIAQALISLVRYHELNRETHLIRDIMETLLGSLEQPLVVQEQSLTETTIH